jgi:hypothetical protein
MSKAKTLYNWYIEHKEEFRTDTNETVIFAFVNKDGLRRLKPYKNRSGNMWTINNILFIDEIPISVKVSGNVVFVHPTYLEKLSDISPIKRYSKEIIKYLNRRNVENLPVDAETVSMIVERILE